jgi:hypothetical protein
MTRSERVTQRNHKLAERFRPANQGRGHGLEGFGKRLDTGQICRTAVPPFVMSA